MFEHPHEKGPKFGWNLLNGALKGMLAVAQRGNANYEHTVHLPQSPCRGLNCELVAGYMVAVLVRDVGVNNGGACPALDKLMSPATVDKQCKLIGGLLVDAVKLKALKLVAFLQQFVKNIFFFKKKAMNVT